MRIDERQPHTMTSAAQNQPDTPPRIVMLLANEFVHDTRVFKEARSLIEWGCEVHVIGVARNGLPTREIQQEIHVRRVPTYQSGLFDVLATLAVWWSRPLLRRLLSRHIASSDDTPAEPAIATEITPAYTGPVTAHSNGSACSREPSIATAPPAAPSSAPNRSLPARAWRRLKVYARRSRKYASRATRRTIASIDRGRETIASINRGRETIARSTAKPRPAIGLRARTRRLIPPAARLLPINHLQAVEAVELEPDVIVAHDLNTLFGAMIVRRACRIPVVYDSHELYLERNIGDKSRFMDKLFWRPIERFGIRRCAAVMTVANGICDHLRDTYRIGRPALVRNVQPYEPPATRTRLLSDELGIDPSRAIVLYPGAVTINRGLEQMIDSAVHLRGAAYVIMGYARNPAFLESLRSRAADLGQLGRTVFFREAVPIDDVVRYTASADLCIVPTQNVCLSYQFESSNKIFHSLMAGVPLAMSDHVEKRHIAETYGIGVLFDETNPQSIARVVNDVLEDRDRYEHMRRCCLTAARELNWEHEQHTLRGVFAGILGPRARPVPTTTINAPSPTVDAFSSPSPAHT